MSRARKLTKENVVDIWGRLLDHEESVSIAKDFPCTPQNIMSIEKGMTWRHVTSKLRTIKAKPFVPADPSGAVVGDPATERTLIDEIFEDAQKEREERTPAAPTDEPPVPTSLRKIAYQVDKLIEMQSRTNYLLKRLLDEWCK